MSEQSGKIIPTASGTQHEQWRDQVAVKLPQSVDELLRGYDKKKKMKLFRSLIIIQSGYMLITAVWPLLHIDSFMEMTGSKTDVWLVKTVGALLIPISLSLFYQLFTKEKDKATATILGGGSAIAFIIIDFYYSLSDTISNIYMADGVLQFLFFLPVAVHNCYSQELINALQRLSYM